MRSGADVSDVQFQTHDPTAAGVQGETVAYLGVPSGVNEKKVFLQWIPCPDKHGQAFRFARGTH
jgi:hypothetical protein